MTQTKKLNLTFLILTIVYIGGSLLYGVLTDGMNLPVYADLAAAQLLILLPVWGYTRWDHINLHGAIGHRGLGLAPILCLIGIMLLAMPLLAFLNLISSLFAGNAASDLSQKMIGGPGWLNLLFLAVIPSISEEFVFRGVFFHGYRRHGFWRAALMSGLIFGLMHLNFNQFSYGFALGVLFAAVVEATGSIYASMTIHFLINLQSVSLINGMSALGETGLQQTVQIEISSVMEQTYLTMAIVILGIVSVITTALLVLLIRLLAKVCGREDYFRWVLHGGEKEALMQREPQQLFDPFFFAGAVVCLGFMVYALLMR